MVADVSKPAEQLVSGLTESDLVSLEVWMIITRLCKLLWSLRQFGMDLLEALQSTVETCDMEYCLASLKGKQGTTIDTNSQKEHERNNSLHFLQVCQVQVEQVVV